MKDKTNFKVSIIITLKNAEEHLNECLDSVFNQTLKDIEVVCIDGKSTDKSLDILDSYQKKYKKLFVYTQTSTGVGAAKNLGIEKARGEFITFLDADDFYIDNDSLEKMYNAAKEYDVKICGAFRAFKMINGDIVPSKLHRGLLVGFPNGRMFSYKYTQYDYHFHSYIYDRKMIINSDARFMETKVYDDTNFHIRAMLTSKNFYVVPVTLYCYRLHEAYSWSEDNCVQAVKNLTNQLKLTKDNELMIGHYVTFQRISNEYGPMFKKYIKKGNKEILNAMLKAQDEVNQEYIDYIVKNRPDQNVISPMDFPDEEVKKYVVKDETKYILRPLLEHLGVKEVKGEVNGVNSEVSKFRKIRKTKIWKIAVWIPKKILKFLKLR